MDMGRWPYTVRCMADAAADVLMVPATVVGLSRVVVEWSDRAPAFSARQVSSCETHWSDRRVRSGRRCGPQSAARGVGAATESMCGAPDAEARVCGRNLGPQAENRVPMCLFYTYWKR